MTCDHAAIKADPARWAALPRIGDQPVEAFEDEPAYRLELRNCICGSTLAVEIKETP